MAKVHYPCGGWADNTGAHAACVRKCFKNKSLFDGRASHVTCKKCLYKAISKGSQWNSKTGQTTITVEKISINGLGMPLVMFKGHGFRLLQNFTVEYEPRL